MSNVPTPPTAPAVPQERSLTVKRAKEVRPGDRRVTTVTVDETRHHANGRVTIVWSDGTSTAYDAEDGLPDFEQG